MKRTPLKRKTPLRGGGKPLRKSRLKPMSKEKLSWKRQYWERCSKDGRKLYESRHHPYGQQNAFILCYVIIPFHLHDKIHAKAQWAREVGWLQGPFEGRPYDPSAHRPWSIAQEDHWPAEYRRVS